MADQMIGAWEMGSLNDLLQGVYPGLFDTTNMFRSMMTAPFQKQAGGGVDNLGYRNQLIAQQVNPARGQLASSGLELANTFAKLLTGNAASLTNINTMIQKGRNSNSGGLLGILGL